MRTRATIILIAACSACASHVDGGPTDAAIALLAFPDVWYPDSGPNEDAGFVSLSGCGVCDGFGQRCCSDLADLALPGWSTFAICNNALGSIAADQGTPQTSDVGIAGYACGTGPACAPDLVCARSWGDPSPPRCVAPSPQTTIDQVDGMRCLPDDPPPQPSECLVACTTWGASIAPSGTVGLATCRDTQLRAPCIRASECASGGCRCGEGPPCGSGEACVRTADGGVGCVCRTGHAL
jgi:hypothetical protein